MKITIIRAQEEPKVIYEGEYRKVPLQEMYELLECDLVERLPLPDDKVEIWIDEEGKLKDEFNMNALATLMFKGAFNGMETNPDYDWYVAGHALVIERSPEELEKYNNEE